MVPENLGPGADLVGRPRAKPDQELGRRLAGTPDEGPRSLATHDDAPATRGSVQHPEVQHRRAHATPEAGDQLGTSTRTSGHPALSIFGVEDDRTPELDTPGNMNPLAPAVKRQRRHRIVGAAALLATGLVVAGMPQDLGQPPPGTEAEAGAPTDEWPQSTDAANATGKTNKRYAAQGPRAVPPEAQTFGMIAIVGADPGRGIGAGHQADLSRGWAPPYHTEAYDSLDDNPFISVTTDPRSTFSIDVDTASYALVRRHLTAGVLPPSGAVRLEEMINYFSYSYPEPNGPQPFAISTEVATAPWQPAHKLVRVGIKGRHIEAVTRPPVNLVFLIDVSGSMQSPDKLPLLKRGFALLTEQLDARDRVSIVVYAGASGLALPPTPGDRKGEILQALADLEGGGSTNGASGIRLAYAEAARARIPGGVNRVVLATDGDFNVGTTSQSELVELIEKKRAEGTFLSVLGFGTGNYKDSTLEKLADRGNGNYAYIDSLAEARKVLVEQATGTLVTIAKDVKIQVEFNPQRVVGFRLIGYENRKLAHRDFTDDAKDAGDIGADHSVTALYEIVPIGHKVPGGEVGPLRYQRPAVPSMAASSDELLTVKLRYKAPEGATSNEVGHFVFDADRSFADASPDFRFAASVAEFGMLLRDSAHKGRASYDQVLGLARGAQQGDDRRGEFVSLARMARDLSG